MMLQSSQFSGPEGKPCQSVTLLNLNTVLLHLSISSIHNKDLETVSNESCKYEFTVKQYNLYTRGR